MSLNAFWRVYRISLLIQVIPILIAQPLPAQEMPVQAELQVPIILNLLTFDRNLNKRCPDKIVLGILYQSRSLASLNASREFAKALERTSAGSIKGIPFRYFSIDLYKLDFSQVLVPDSINIVYLCPLAAVDIQSISRLCRQNGILSLSGVPEYSKYGISVCLGQKGDKPEIIINLEASAQEGAGFSSRLLQLARVIKDQEIQ